MLFNEPKLLKLYAARAARSRVDCFSALQRAEIAEIITVFVVIMAFLCFSALQRAEIAEIVPVYARWSTYLQVSVLFNEPKLLKSYAARIIKLYKTRFSALQRAEIAEMRMKPPFVE